MILMLILAAWILALATVASLCAMARRGDVAQHPRQHNLQLRATGTESAALTLSSSEARRSARPNLAAARKRIWLDRRHARAHPNAVARRAQEGWRGPAE